MRRLSRRCRRELSWSHFVEIIPLEDPLKRDFYAEMCRIERWSTRTLRHKIGHLLYERTAVSKKPEELIVQDLAALRDEDRMTPDLVFRDPYFLDFLGLTGSHVEKDVEQAILRELEAFILELGSDFAFVARQKRISVDNEDYYLDLLFYHRRLRRLVAIDLKLEKFQAGDKGQMELYLRWLERYDTRPGEEPPLGLILCADKSEEHVELLQLDKSGIRVAQYLTELPPRELLEKTLHNSIRRARERLAIAKQDDPAETHRERPPVAGRRVENEVRRRKDSEMTPVEVPPGLVDALRLDLVGPENGSELESEVLNQAPSRWYLTGFLVPLEADPAQKTTTKDRTNSSSKAETPTRATTTPSRKRPWLAGRSSPPRSG